MIDERDAMIERAKAFWHDYPEPRTTSIYPQGMADFALDQLAAYEAKVKEALEKAEAANKVMRSALEWTERILIRIEDVQHGGKDDDPLLADVDALRRCVTLILRPPNADTVLQMITEDTTNSDTEKKIHNP